MDVWGDDDIDEHGRKELANPYPQATTTKDQTNGETIHS